MKKTIIKLIRTSKTASYLLSLYFLSRDYLSKEGWKQNVKKGLPIDGAGKELPWFTYSGIKFIEARLNQSLNVFEFGSGNSTIWFGQRVNSVISLEHDKAWFDDFKATLDPLKNVTYQHKTLEQSAYTNEILQYRAHFDIIVIDGRQRVKCAKNSVGSLNNKGIIIWDNSDRTHYEEGYQFLASEGFKRLDFWGLGPINPYASFTSIFYRNDNCLGI